MQEAVDAILELKPKAHLIVICEDKKQVFKNATVVIKSPKDDLKANLWGYILNNIGQRSFYSGRHYFFQKKTLI